MHKALDPRLNRIVAIKQLKGQHTARFKQDVLARSDGEVVDGHLRLKAAHKLGITEVPVLLRDEWTPAQVKAFRLLVNRSATWAEFDEELLALELQDLQAADLDLILEDTALGGDNGESEVVSGVI